MEGRKVKIEMPWLRALMIQSTFVYGARCSDRYCINAVWGGAALQ